MPRPAHASSIQIYPARGHSALHVGTTGGLDHIATAPRSSFFVSCRATASRFRTWQTHAPRNQNKYFEWNSFSVRKKCDLFIPTFPSAPLNRIRSPAAFFAELKVSIPSGTLHEPSSLLSRLLVSFLVCTLSRSRYTCGESNHNRLIMWGKLVAPRTRIQAVLGLRVAGRN